MAGSTQWRAANSLTTLLKQVNAMYPDRSKASDGLLGDTQHSTTMSDHNPDASGIVYAVDVTHDPAHGLNIAELAMALTNSRDVRIKYVIANGRIWFPASGWRTYTGSNPHTQHMHLSVTSERGDDDTLWQIGEDMIEDTDNEFSRWNLTHMFTRARGSDRATFKGLAVGTTWLKQLEILQDNPEAQEALKYLQVGRVAVRSSWETQIATLLERVTQLTKELQVAGNNPNQANYEQALATALTCQTQLKAMTTKNEQLEQEKVQDQETGNAIARWLARLFRGG